MAARLLIRYLGPGEPLDWVTEDERGRVLAGPGSSQRIADDVLSGAREIVVIAPAEDTLLLECDVPARSREQLQRALPFALEDAVAEPIEALHFVAVANPGGSGQVACAVSRARVREWLDDLASRGIRPDLLVPEGVLLPLEPGRAAVLVEDERCLVRSAPGRAFVAEKRELPAWLATLDAPRDESGRVRVTVHADTDDSAFLGLGISVEPAAEEAPALRVLARGLRQAPPLNLLSGALAPQHRGAPVLRLWRVAGMLAAALAVLGFAWFVLDYWQLARRHAALAAEMQAIYRDVYPGGRTVGSPAQRMRADYAQAAGSARADGALALLASVAPVLTQGTQNSLKALEYRGGTLELTLLAPGVAALDAVRESAATLPGVRAELVSANAGERGAEGRLRIVAAGAR